MSTPERSDGMRDALHYLVTSDTPPQHKRILIQLVVEAMRDDETAVRHSASAPEVDANWQPHEAKAIELFLQGRIARNWQHADEILMRLAAQLHRKPAQVRTKATELGFGAGVDYRLSQQQVSTDGEGK
jgi:hypothetical protein